MEYREYFGRKVKGVSLQILGLILALSGIAGLFSNGLFLILIIGGIGLLFWGEYILRKLRFDRENTGHRLYHSKGNY